MRLPSARRVAPFLGLVAVALFAGAIVTLSLVGTEDGEPAAEWGEALAANGHWAQLSGYLHGLAGLSLAAFLWSLTAREDADRAVPAWGRFGGVAWGASFVLGGAMIFAAAELAGYQAHAEGAKTALVLGHLMYANPLAALLGSACAFAVGLAPPAGLPRWFGRFSLGAGGLALAVTLVGGFGGIGLLGMGPLALWLAVAMVVAPWAARRRG